MTFYRSILSPSVILKEIKEDGPEGRTGLFGVFREQDGDLIPTGDKNWRCSRSNLIEIEKVTDSVPFDQSKHDALKDNLFTRNGEKVFMLTTKARGPRPMKGYIGEVSDNLCGWPLNGRYDRQFGNSNFRSEDHRDLFVVTFRWMDRPEKQEDEPVASKTIHLDDVDAIANALADRMVGMLRDALTGKFGK